VLVLLVESDEGTALPLRCTLEREGHAVEVAASGHDALARLRDGGVDLLVVDGDLTGTDGAALARLVRRERLASAVILLTAGARRPWGAVPTDGTALLCLAKPFTVREFVARTRLVLRRGAAQP